MGCIYCGKRVVLVVLQQHPFFVLVIVVVVGNIVMVGMKVGVAHAVGTFLSRPNALRCIALFIGLFIVINIRAPSSPHPPLPVT